MKGLISHAQIMRDKNAILRVLGTIGRPLTFSDLLLYAGESLHDAHDALIREGAIVACFPEAQPGDSGRQHWRLA